jgi:hypothetical protein
MYAGEHGSSGSGCQVFLDAPFADGDRETEGLPLTEGARA